MDDASLDDFLDDGESSSDDDAATDQATAEPEEGATDEPTTEPDDGATAEPDEASEDADESGSDEGAGDDVAPATSTMTFSPDGASCGACGERVVRRWTDDGALVCRACKEW